MLIIHHCDVQLAFVQVFYLEMPILIEVFPNVRLSFMKLDTQRRERDDIPFAGFL